MLRAVAAVCFAIVVCGCAGSAERAAKVEQLIATLETGDDDARAAAASQLMMMGPSAGAAVPALIRNLGSGRGKRQQLNIAAANALLRIGPGAALDPLVAALDNEDPEIAYGAAFTIGGYGRAAKSAVPALLKALENPDKREGAQVALRMIRDES